MLDQIGFENIYNDVKEVMSMTSKSLEYSQRVGRIHSDRGTLRSGEGSPEQRYIREL